MSDELEKTLDQHLKHAASLGEIGINLNARALKCGFPSMEQYEYLLEGEGNLVVMAARPGNGKTALSCQIALNVAERGKVLYFSLEMKKETLKKRLLAVTSGVPIKKLGEQVFRAKVEKALEFHNTLKLHIIDTPGLSVSDVISKTYDENNREKISLVVIDYLGIMKYKGVRRNEEIAEAVYRLKKDVAEKLGIPVLALAQMKRGFEDRYAKAKMEFEKAKQYKNSEANSKILEIRPSLEDLGESSGIEHASDVIMFLQRPYLLDPDLPEDVFKVYVCKNRNGEVKDFDLEFSSTLTKFIDKGRGDWI